MPWSSGLGFFTGQWTPALVWFSPGRQHVGVLGPTGIVGGEAACQGGILRAGS